jgi:hypothetical protein
MYQRCQNKGITPQEVVDGSKEILRIAEKIPISRIPEHVQTMIVEKQNLE